jgi:ElaB/YqjD/DUF883 family membrane-anchored ribosome-binding protein
MDPTSRSAATSQTGQPGANGAGDAAARLSEELQRVKDNIAGMASSAGDDLAGQLRRIQDELGNIQQTVTGLGQGVGSEAAAAAGRMKKVGIDAAKEFAAGAREETASAVDDFVDFTRRNPGFALAATLGVGFFAGLLMRRS